MGCLTGSDVWRCGLQHFSQQVCATEDLIRQGRETDELDVDGLKSLVSAYKSH